jgi:ABC-type glycerol-3-phosphate transport system substrate-binding protein
MDTKWQKKSWRTKFAAGVMAVMAVSIASVGGTSGSATASGRAAQAHTPVTLSWQMWIGGPADIKEWNYDASLVHKMYPWITVKLTSEPSYSDYWIKLPVDIASNTEQDIIATQNLRTSSFASGFLPVSTAQLTSNGPAGYSLSGFDQGALDGYKVSSGKFIALPYDFGPLLMFYNRTVFQRYNLTLPSNTWTWKQFNNDLAAIKNKSGGSLYGYADDPFFDEFLTYATDMGAHYLNAQGALKINTPGFASLLKQYVAPVTTGLAPLPPSNAATTGQWNLQEWQSGSAAMYIDGPWDLINDISAVKMGYENFKIGIAPLPNGPNGKSSTLLSGSGFGISKDLYKSHPGMSKSELLSDAIKAIEVLTGPQFEKYNAASGDFPSRSADYPYYFKTLAGLGITNATAPMLYALKDAVPYNATNKWNGTESAFNTEIVGVMQGSITPAAALNYTQANQGAPIG